MLSFKHLFGVAALAAAPFALGGCEDNESALFVRSVVKLEAGDCLARAQPDATMLPFGTLDTSFEGNYVASLLVGNQLARQGDRDKVRTETARVALRGAVVSVRDPLGSELQAFTSDGAGFVDPGNGNEPGYGIMFAELLPRNLVTAPPGGATSVNVSVRVFGETLGGRDIESSELIFPITVCDGCLVSFPTDAILNGECAKGTPPEDLPCNFGQDTPVDCRLCSDNDKCDPTPGSDPTP
jgi:hypothetical protein